MKVCGECKYYRPVGEFINEAFCVKIAKWVLKDEWNCGEFKEKKVGD